MAGAGVGRVFSGSSGGVGASLLYNSRLPSSSQSPDSFFISGSSSNFLGNLSFDFAFQLFVKSPLSKLLFLTDFVRRSDFFGFFMRWV